MTYSCRPFAVAYGRQLQGALKILAAVLAGDRDRDGDSLLPAWHSSDLDEVARTREHAADGTPYCYITYRSRAATYDTETLARGCP